LNGGFAERVRAVSQCGSSKESAYDMRGFSCIPMAQTDSAESMNKYTVSGAHIEISFPGDWQVTAQKNTLSAYSPGDIVLFYVDPFELSGDKDLKTSLKDYIDKEYGGDDLELGNYSAITVGEFKANYWTFSYVDGEYGKAEVMLIVVETKKGMAMLTVDMLTEGKEDYKTLIDKILAGVKYSEDSEAAEIEGKMVTHAKSGLKVWIPTAWDTLNDVNRLDSYSDGDVALIIVEKLSDKSWSDFSKTAYDTVHDYIADDIGDDFEVKTKGETEINGMKAYKIEYDYIDGSYGKAISMTIALETEKGIAAFTYDILEEGLDEYLPVAEKMLASLTKASGEDSVVVNKDTQNYVVKGTYLELNIPTDWQVDKYSGKLSGYSPNDTIILYVDRLNDKSFDDYQSKDDIKKDMEKFAKGEYSYDLTFGKLKETKVGGMSAVSVPFTYHDESYGDISCEYYGIDTGKGISTIIFDTLDEGGGEYEQINADILASVKFNDSGPAEGGDTTVDVSGSKSYIAGNSCIELQIPASWEVDNSPGKLSGYSPNDTVLLYVEPMNKKSFDDYSSKEDFLDEFKNFAKEAYSYELSFDEKEITTVGGMPAVSLPFSYYDESYGDIHCQYYAIDTGKGIATVIFDVLEEGGSEYEQINADILASVKFNDSEYTDSGDVTVNTTPGEYQHAKSHLKMTVPSDWSTSSYESDLTSYSPNSSIILYVLPLNDKSLKDYKKSADLLKEVDKSLKDHYYASMDYQLQDKGKEKVGGMDAMKFFMTYSDASFGEIDVTVHAIDTGKGISMVIFDGIRKEADPYKDAIAGILASVQFYDVKSAPVIDSGIDISKVKGKFYMVNTSRLKIWVPDNFSTENQPYGSTQNDYQFYSASIDGAVILKIFTYQDDYLNIKSLDSKEALSEFLTGAGFYSFTVKDAKTVKFNGKDAMIINFNYQVDAALTAVCRAIAIDTDNGISIYVEDILQPDMKKYKEIMDKIGGSIEVIRVPYDGTLHPWAQ
jgi:predicted Zn-dependent protease